jgi:hypothetical protein
LAVAAQFQQLTAGVLLHGGLRAWNLADRGEADGDRAAELGLQRFAVVFARPANTSLENTGAMALGHIMALGNIAAVGSPSRPVERAAREPGVSLAVLR